MTKLCAKSKSGPLTIERIENALDILAKRILAHKKRGHILLPIYKRLETELAKMVEEERLMDEVRKRAASQTKFQAPN